MNSILVAILILLLVVVIYKTLNPTVLYKTAVIEDNRPVYWNTIDSEYWPWYWGRWGGRGGSYVRNYPYPRHHVGGRGGHIGGRGGFGGGRGGHRGGHH